MGLGFGVNWVRVGFKVLGDFWDDSVGFEKDFGPSQPSLFFQSYPPMSTCRNGVSIAAKKLSKRKEKKAAKKLSMSQNRKKSGIKSIVGFNLRLGRVKTQNLKPKSQDRTLTLLPHTL